MKPAPISKQHPKVTQRTVGEKGYVLVLVALMILPLVGFTGFAVDLGSWYGRAAQIQRASDASALAGVQKLPNLPAAIAAAKSVAAQNGFVDGVDGITVTVVQVPDINAKLSVTIQDSKAAQYFTNMFRSNVTIKRTGTAQFLKPLQMGSPKNFLGTGSQFMQGGSSGSCGSNTADKCFRENFWLAASGGCASKENGDRLLATTDGNYFSRGFSCSGGNTNPEYDSTGYFYAIEFAQNMTGTYRVDIFDYGYCTSGPAGDSSGAFTATFQLRNNDSLDPRATTTLGSAKGSSSGNGCNTWTNLGTINNPTKGTYFVQVTSNVGGNGRNGTNGFGIRAYPGSTFSACTATASEANSGVSYSAGCPQVYGYGAMGVQADVSRNPAVFYLTQIQGHDYDNKQLELELWDPGEGARAIQILDPLGSPVFFDWQVYCYNGLPPTASGCADGTPAPRGGWSGSSSTIHGDNLVNALDLGGVKYVTTTSYDDRKKDTQPGPNRTSTWKYSDRLVKLTIQLPADVPAAYGSQTWFKIRYYTFGSSVSDRTTWSASIQGAPVRLIPNP